MFKWLREHRGFFVFICVTVILLIAATMFLMIHFREAIFSQTTLAIIIFAALGALILFLAVVMGKVLNE